jgi:glutamyl-tRNA reductase
VKLVNIDGLNSRISANKKRRSREIPKARRIIDELTRQFVAWNESLDIVPIIARLSRKGEELARMEARRYAKHFPGGGAEKLEVFARSLVKKILHGPISAVKSDNGEEPTAEQLQAAELIGRMFFAPPSKRQ